MAKIYETSNAKRVISEWCREHSIHPKEVRHLVSQILGHPYDRHPEYSKIKSKLKLGMGVTEISAVTGITTYAIQQVINMYDELHDMYYKKIGISDKRCTPRQKIVVELKKMGIRISNAANYLPNEIYHAVPYNKLVSLGMSTSQIDKMYTSLEIDCEDKSLPPRRTMRVDFISDIVKDLFYGDSFETVMQRYDLPYYMVVKITTFYSILDARRKDIRYNLRLFGKCITDEITVELRNLMIHIHPKCLPKFFSDVPSGLTIPPKTILGESVKDLHEIARAATTKDLEKPAFILTEPKPIVKTIEKPVIPEVIIEKPVMRKPSLDSNVLRNDEIYSMYKEGASTEFISKKFNLSIDEITDICRVQKDLMGDIDPSSHTLDVKDRVIMLYKSYRTVEYISEDTGKTVKEVNKILRSNSVNIRSKTVEVLDRLEIVNVFKSGKSIKEISEEFHAQPRTIRSIIHYFMAKVHNQCNDLVYHPKMELSNWTEFEIALLESDMTDNEISKMMDLPKILITTKREELKEVNNAN